jgi:dTDP-glucose 4,6-dehydratase
MNLLVTGGCGFIGSAFIRWFLGDDAERERAALKLERLVNLDALTYAGNPANVAAVQRHPLYHFVHGDITNAAHVDDVFQSHRITAVLHLAAESHVDRSIDDPGQFIQTNVVGTHGLLAVARRAWSGASGTRFVHVSTDEVFGTLEPGDPPFHEGSAYAPNSPYAASKAAADHLARAYGRTYGLPVIISNCSNNYGPHQFPEKLIPLTILNALDGKPLAVYGDGQQVRDWLFVEDHARALAALLLNGRIGETYMLGGGTELANLELVRLICAGLDRRRPRAKGSYADLIEFVSDRPGHDRRYATSAAKAQRELGWAPREPLPIGLDRTLDWYLANRAWCVTIADAHRQRLGLPTGQG